VFFYFYFFCDSPYTSDSGFIFNRTSASNVKRALRSVRSRTSENVTNLSTKGCVRAYEDFSHHTSAGGGQY